MLTPPPFVHSLWTVSTFPTAAHRWSVEIRRGAPGIVCYKPPVNFQYQLKRQTETIGSVQLAIECLEDMNQTIDQVFEYLEKAGKPEALEELCPYFGVVWPAALGLAKYLDAHLPKWRSPSTLEKLTRSGEPRSPRILELGCGLAIPSMIAAKHGAEVVATDSHVDVPRFLEKNLQLNQITGVRYQSVNWETHPPDLGAFDWIIGSDILYERRYAETLARAIAERFRPEPNSSKRVVIADPGRPYLQNFADAMKGHGFSCTTTIESVVNSTAGLGSTQAARQEIFVLEFRR